MQYFTQYKKYAPLYWLIFIFIFNYGCSSPFVIRDSNYTITIPNVNSEEVSRLDMGMSDGIGYFIGDSTTLTISSYANGCDFSEFDYQLTNYKDQCQRENEILIGLKFDFNDSTYDDRRLKIIRKLNNNNYYKFRYEYWIKICNKDRIIYIMAYKEFSQYNLNEALRWSKRFNNTKITIKQ